MGKLTAKLDALVAKIDGFVAETVGKVDAAKSKVTTLDAGAQAKLKASIGKGEADKKAAAADITGMKADVTKLLT